MTTCNRPVMLLQLKITCLCLKNDKSLKKGNRIYQNKLIYCWLLQIISLHSYQQLPMIFKNVSALLGLCNMVVWKIRASTKLYKLERYVKWNESNLLWLSMSSVAVPYALTLLYSAGYFGSILMLPKYNLYFKVISK